MLLVYVIGQGALEGEGLVAVFALERFCTRVKVFVIDEIVAMPEHFGAVPAAEGFRSFQEKY